MTISFFLPLLQANTVSLFCDNVSTFSYLKKVRGMGFFFSTLNDLALRILRECELHQIVLVPQFVSGSMKVIADALSRSN